MNGSSFNGSSRGISALIEPLKYTKKIKSIQRLIEESDLFETDLDALIRDDLIEGIYVSPSVLEQKSENPCDELLVWINGGAEIDYTPNDYNILDDEKDLRFAFIRYYLLIIKDCIIPPKYIKKIK